MPIKKTFTLYNINPSVIDERNNFCIKSNISIPSKFSSNITHLDAIPTNNINSYFSYLDESKKKS